MRTITFLIAFVFCLGLQANDRQSTIKMSVDTTIEVKPGADIVFVVDDSGSMGSYQQILINHMDYFADEIESISGSTGTYNVFHLGVVTTTLEAPFVSYGGSYGGQLNNGFVTTDDVDWKETFKKNLDVGTMGSGEEKSYDVISMMFENKSNLDFRRPLTPLYFVFVTDEPDQIGMMTHELLTIIDTQVPGRDYVSASAFIPMTTNANCPKPFGNTGNYNVTELVTALGGNQYDLCDTTNFAVSTRQLGQDILAIVKDSIETVYRKSVKIFGTVDFTSIKVSFNGKDLDKGNLVYGYSFNPETNLIQFGEKVDFSVAPTEQIHIEYTVK